MKIEQDDQLAARVAKSWLGVDFAPPMIGLLIMREPALPAGAVIFNNYNARNIDMSGVGVGCWTVPVIRELARYVFVKLRCQRVTAQTRPDNRKARRALERMGFKQEGVLRDWFGDGEDAVIYGLTAKEQRLIR